MITIDEEIQNFIHFLSQGIDYTVVIGNISLSQVCTGDECWVVSWAEEDEGITLNCQKDFNCLFDAVQCFVEKRRYMCVGADFDKLKESVSDE